MKPTLTLNVRVTGSAWVRPRLRTPPRAVTFGVVGQADNDLGIGPR